MKEIYYPGTKSNLQSVTNFYVDWLESGAPLPKENLFTNIHSDKSPL